MLKTNRSLFLSFFILFFSLTAFAQNKFEGYNLFLDVPDTQKAATCALRYSAPTTDITITDLNRSTPMKLSSCGDATERVTQSNSSTAVMRASSTNYKWCFSGEDKRYRISFKGDSYVGQVTYDWIATPETPGIYNIKDFGAVGDGTTDNTTAFKSAMAFIASRNGGTLQIPEGDFVVGSTVALPSGIIIQGISGITTGAPTNNVVKENPSRIRLKGTNRALFRIGECVENIAIRDLELYGSSNENTSGIEAVGAFMSSQNFYFERVVFNNFNRGFYAHGLPITTFAWQFDYVKFNHCRFVYNRDAGIYSDVINSDWKIEGSMFLNPKRTPQQNANSMHFEHAGDILVSDTYGGGFTNAIGGIYLDVTDSAAITVINSQSESMTAALVYNGAVLPDAGDYSYPITFVNNIFDAPIIFKARRTFVSTGNLYGPKTFRTDERLRVYSTGDRFCYDGYTLGCQNAMSSNNFDKATVVFMTGQPDEGMVKGRSTFFGTDVQFGAMVQMPSLLQNALPAGKPNGSMVYCSDCRRDTTPCQAGGSGAPAMVVGNQWICL
ncbi:hypothetical protein BH18ACI1_BH18ACI1_04000 [soil metagenome]